MGLKFDPIVLKTKHDRMQISIVLQIGIGARLVSLKGGLSEFGCLFFCGVFKLYICGLWLLKIRISFH